MRLEEEIKQPKFRDEFQKCTINIVYTANWLSSVHNGALKQYDLTAEQFNILRILRGQYPHPATINLLIDRMLNKMSNASRLVEKLRQKGLAERKTCIDDRRACDVVITQQGLQLLSELDQLESQWHFSDKITKAEATTLNALLDKIRR